MSTGSIHETGVFNPPSWEEAWPEPAGGHPVRTKRARTRRTLKVIGACLLWAVFGTLFTFAWPSNLGGAATWVVVSGHSMEPTFYTGDLVLIWRTHRWEVGDAVSYKVGGANGGSYNVIHRLISHDPDNTWMARGDNKPNPDPWRIPDYAVEGEEVFHIPKFGNVVAMMRGPKLLAAGVGVLIAVAIIIGPEVGKDQKKDGSGGKESAGKKDNAGRKGKRRRKGEPKVVEGE